MRRGVLRFALLADGQSDRALVSVIRWTLRQCDAAVEFADAGFRRRDPSADFLAEMRETIELFSPQVLFVHRDAEGQDPEARRQEIPDIDRSLVRVVPVRMTEAWLMFDEAAIRTAAGNPHGRDALDLPPIGRAEQVADPKARLRDALLAAAAVTGRRRKRLLADLPAVVQRVADLIEDYAPLRRLPAFRRFEGGCREAIASL